MPEYIAKALESKGLLQDHLDRPAYQQNDYLGWIKRAKQLKTKNKRLQQMLSKLRTGGIYMKMTHPPSEKNA